MFIRHPVWLGHDILAEEAGNDIDVGRHYILRVPFRGERLQNILDLVMRRLFVDRSQVSYHQICQTHGLAPCASHLYYRKVEHLSHGELKLAIFWEEKG